MAPAPDAFRWLFRDQPAGLSIIVLTGMWEVFALFGMRTVLIFYLVDDLSLGEAAAIQIYSLSTAASFAMTLIGALLADRLFGVKRAVVIGALLMAAGHLMLVAPKALYLALALVVLGNGLLKPALVSQIGRLYAVTDPRRDRAFVLYKAGCNAGAIFSPIACGTIGEAFGWSAALALCGVGMCVSAAIFILGRRCIAEVSEGEMSASVGAGGGSKLKTFVTLALVLLCGGLFWSAHGQQGGAIALWADSSVERAVQFGDLSYTVPAPWFQSINPIIIVAFTPLLTWLWSRHEQRSRGTTELKKLTTGSLFLAASFAVVAIADAQSGGGKVNVFWIVGSLTLLAIGELYFDAVGQAFAVRIAPPKAMTTFVSFWFLVQALGFAVAGWIGLAWGMLSPTAYFLIVAGIAIVGATVTLGMALTGRGAGEA